VEDGSPDELVGCVHARGEGDAILITD